MSIFFEKIAHINLKGKKETFSFKISGSEEDISELFSLAMATSEVFREAAQKLYENATAKEEDAKLYLPSEFEKKAEINLYKTSFGEKIIVKGGVTEIMVLINGGVLHNADFRDAWEDFFKTAIDAYIKKIFENCIFEADEKNAKMCKSCGRHKSQHK